jgi:hypothetical protein
MMTDGLPGISERFLNCLNIRWIDDGFHGANQCETNLELERTDFDDEQEYWKGTCPDCGDVYEFSSKRVFTNFTLVDQVEVKQ